MDMWIRQVVCLVAAVGFVSDSWAYETITTGVESRAQAGLGVAVSRGASSLETNPANLIMARKIELYGELSFLSLNLSYAHPNFDPMNVSAASPLPSAGFAAKFGNDLAFGLYIVPTGTGDERLIEDVPIDIGGQDQLTQVAMSDAGFKLSAGGAYRFADEFTLGLSLRHTTANKTLRVEADQAEAPLIDSSTASQTNQLVVGIRSHWWKRRVAMALRYSPAVSTQIQGEDNGLLAEAIGDNSISTVSYTPMIIGFGTEVRYKAFGAHFEYLFEQYSAGRFVETASTSVEIGETNFFDTHNFSVGGNYRVAPRHRIMAGYGFFPGNVGPGAEAEGDFPTMKGVEFGNMDALDRNVFSGGYRYYMGAPGYLLAALSYMQGSTYVPEEYPRPGDYELQMITATIGGTYRF